MRAKLDSVTEVEFELECKGLSATDLQAIYKGLRKAFPDCCASFRNPSPLQFDSETVHHITVCLYAAGIYIGKKFIDNASEIMAELVKKKLIASDDGTEKKTVRILGPDGKPASKVEQRPSRRR